MDSVINEQYGDTSMMTDKVSPANNPRMLYFIASGSLLERFSFYGAFTILIFYVEKFLKLATGQSYALYGTYAALAFGLPVFGGLLGDRFFGVKTPIFFGLCLLIIGNLLLALNESVCFYVGLASILMGSGCYKSNAAAFVGELHHHAKHSIRERGFTFLYLSMNIGATLGAIIYATFVANNDWHIGFLISGILLAINTIILLMHHKQITAHKQLNFNSVLLKAIPLLVVAWWLIFSGLIHPNLVGWGLSILLVGIIGYGVHLAARYTIDVKKNLTALVILYSFGMCFFIASLQVTSSINVFISTFTQPMLWGHRIPDLIFSSLYPFAVIAMAPVLAYIWYLLKKRDKEVSTTGKITLGLWFGVFAFVAFTMMVLVSHKLDHFAPVLTWIVIGNLLLGAGELVIFPGLLALTSQLTPTGFRGFMMGFCYLFVAIAGYLSGFINKWYQNTLAPVPTVASYWHLFIGLAVGLVLVACLLQGVSHRLHTTGHESIKLGE